MNDQTEEIDVQYLRGTALPRYVERLDDVEWVTDRRHPYTVTRTLALIALVIGACLLVIGFASLADGMGR